MVSDPKDPDLSIKQLETQLEEAKRRYENSEQELDALIYHLSHDLRAPLRGIDGYSQALLEDYSAQLGPIAKAYLEYIRDSSKRLSTLIDGLLQLSKIEHAPLDIETIDLSNLTRMVMDDLTTSLSTRKIEFFLKDGMMIQADPALMKTLMICLLDNAIKFSSNKPETKIEFSNMTMGEKTVFYVRDNGLGFRASEVDQLFISFQSLPSHAKLAGMGLGLATAKRILHRHNGQIWAEGEPENGATFYFSI